MLPLLIPIIAKLAESGLSILGNAIIAKGKDVVEAHLGVNIDDAMQTEEGKIKLLQLQQTHEEFLLNANIQSKEQELKAQALAYADTASARDMNTRVNESANASLMSKNIAPALALIVVVTGLAMLAFSHDESVRTASVGLVAGVLSFYFGSSQSSKSKDDTIRSLSS
jgi:hypothetical protein